MFHYVAIRDITGASWLDDPWAQWIWEDNCYNNPDEGVNRMWKASSRNANESESHYGTTDVRQTGHCHQ